MRWPNLSLSCPDEGSSRSRPQPGTSPASSVKTEENKKQPSSAAQRSSRPLSTCRSPQADRLLLFRKSRRPCSAEGIPPFPPCPGTSVSLAKTFQQRRLFAYQSDSALPEGRGNTSRDSPAERTAAERRPAPSLWSWCVFTSFSCLGPAPAAGMEPRWAE